MNVVIGFIGLGEAGTVIAEGLRTSGAPRVLAYDVALENEAGRAALERRAMQTPASSFVRISNRFFRKAISSSPP